MIANGRWSTQAGFRGCWGRAGRPRGRGGAGGQGSPRSFLVRFGTMPVSVTNLVSSDDPSFCKYSDHGLTKVCASLRPRIPMYSNGCPWAGLWPECMPTRVRRSRTTVPSNAARGALSVLDRWGVRCTAGGMCVTEMTNSMPLHGVVNVTCLEST